MPTGKLALKIYKVDIGALQFFEEIDSTFERYISTP
jgi:hypothetical protein